MPIRNLFLIGSPVALFGAQENLKKELVVPRQELVQRMYNIYAPLDPVAYRIGKEKILLKTTNGKIVNRKWEEIFLTMRTEKN